MKKTTILSLLILCTCCLNNARAVVPTDNKYSGGSGTEAAPYVIKDFADLKELSETPADWSKYFIQTADIDASETAASSYNNSAGFSPIGTNSSLPFTGNYNGKGYTINNLYINRASGNESDEDYCYGVGLFGYVSGGTIDSVGIINADINGYGYAGALSGFLTNGSQVKHSYVSGNVSGTRRVGTFAGLVYEGSKVCQCYCTGTAIGGSGDGNNIGGFVGRISTNANIYNCYTTAAVKHLDTEGYAGGFCGYSHSSHIENVYSTGLVYEPDGIGRFSVAGYNSSSSFLYNYRDAIASGRDRKITTGTSYLPTDEMKLAASYTAWDIDNSNIWSIIDGKTYPVLDSVSNNAPFAFADSIEIVVSSISLDTLLANDYDYENGQDNLVCVIDSCTDHYGSIANNVFNFNADANVFSVDTVYYRAGEILASGDTLWGNQAMSEIALELDLEGEGTEGSPYQIADFGDLLILSNNPVIWGSYFIQTADIEAGTTASATYDSGYGFSPIGTSPGSPFTGSYNGKGHIVNNLYINRASGNESDENYCYGVGLFGYVSGGTIDSVGITNADINGYGYAGGLVGFLKEGGLVEHSYVSGTVSGSSRVGTFAGLVYTNSTVSQCYCTGTAIGGNGNESNIGGFVGRISTNANIYNCYTTAAVKHLDTEGYAGGFCGYSHSSHIENVYSTGLVYEPDGIGRFSVAGYNSSSSFLYNYRDAIASGRDRNITTGTSYLPTDEMKLANSFNGWDIDNSNIWGISEGETCPVLDSVSNNAPFAFADSFKIVSSISLDSLLDNDFDYETAQEELVYEIISCTENYGSIADSAYSFAATVEDGNSDTICYRVGEIISDGDTLWGNMAQAVVTYYNPMQLVFTTTGANQTIKLPLFSSVDCTVDWGDGSATDDFTTTGLKEHTFANAGTYTVEISGKLTQFGNGAIGWDGAGYLSQIATFGDLGLTSLSGACYDADNLKSVPKELPSTITDLSYMVALVGVGSIENLGAWDIGNVQILKGMLMDASKFNQDISGWDVGKVTSMKQMFYEAKSFDQNIGKWNITSVTDMAEMFYGVTLTTANYDSLLIGWAKQSVQESVTFHGGSSKYLEGIDARKTLTDTYNWTITDGGIDISIVAHDTTVYLDSAGIAELFASDLVTSSTGGTDTILSTDTLYCGNVGISNKIYVTLSNDNGLSATDSAYVDVLDTIVPELETKTAFTAYADSFGNASITLADLVTDTWDNCGIKETTLSKSSFGSKDLGKNNVEVILFDNSGNSDTSTVAVTVKDTIAPILEVDSITVYLDSSGLASIVPGDLTAYAKDNCTPCDTVLGLSKFNYENIGKNGVSVTLKDSVGNETVKTAVVTVADTIVPQLKVQDITVGLDKFGGASITADDLATSTWDNCPVKLSLDQDGFSCNDIGDNRVAVTITDAGGNKAQKTATVTVEDNNPPSFTASNIDVYLDSTGYYELTGNDMLAMFANISDNCSGIDEMSLGTHPKSFTCEDLGTEGGTAILLAAADANGNELAGSTTVTVLDSTAPWILPVADIEIDVEAGTGATGIDYPEITYGDNCGASLTLVSGLGQDGLFPVGTTTETWVAADASGNTDTVSFKVVVKEKTELATVKVFALLDGEAIPPSGITYLFYKKGDNGSLSSIGYSGTATGDTTVFGIVPGEWVILGSPVSNPATFVATYAYGATNWEDASPITLGKNETVGLVLNCVAAGETGEGTYSISGYVYRDSTPSEKSCIVKIEADSGKTPLEGALAKLFKEGGTSPLMTCLTDENGQYRFTGLAAGTYYVKIDIPGLYQPGEYALALGEGNPAGSLSFVANYGTNVITDNEVFGTDSNILMYPNPAGGEVTIEIGGGAHNVSVTVTNIAGRAEIRQEYTATDRISIDMSGKTPGMYMVVLDIDGVREVKKLIVER